MKKIIVFLIFFFIVFFVWGEKLATFDNIYKPRSFQVEGNDLYVVDEWVIKLFSMKDFKLITQFGKKGEGPGEFKYSPWIMVFPDKVFTSIRGKVAFFKRRGKLIEEKRAPIRINVYKVKENYLGREFIFNPKKLNATVEIKALDNNFNLIKEIFTYIHSNIVIRAPGMTQKQDNQMIPEYTRAVTDGEHIFIADTKRGFYIDIFDHAGNKVNTINKEYIKIKVSDEFKKKEMDKLNVKGKLKALKKSFNFVFPEYFPAFKEIFVNIGKIYVLTHIIREKKREIIILDINGKILKKTFVPDKRLFYVSNWKFYYFVDNEDEEVMELHSVDL